VKLSQVRLLVDDFPVCFRFYRSVLGLEPTFGDETDAYASFGQVAIFLRSGQETVVELREPGDAALVCLEVDDLEAAIARIAAAGGQPLGPPIAMQDWGIRVVYLRDPADNLVEVHEALPADDA
jgi:predicted enzyme related to lactoylglutathione lyase